MATLFNLRNNDVSRDVRVHTPRMLSPSYADGCAMGIIRLSIADGHAAFRCAAAICVDSRRIQAIRRNQVMFVYGDSVARSALAPDEPCGDVPF